MNWTEDQKQGFELNRCCWDERVETHWKSQMYRNHAERLRAGSHCLDQQTIRDLGDVTGRSLVHLQCHMGMETLSWSRLGADVVGLDFSAPAIEKAETLRDELALEGRFFCANVYEAAEVIGRTFDIVFVSVGAITWLPDISRWSRVVAEVLKPGGRLYLNEAHPFIDVFDDDDTSQPTTNDSRLAVKYPYLDAGALVFDDANTYADLEATFEHTKMVQYIHTIGSVINSLIEAGLVIDSLVESARCVWPRFKIMQQTGPDDWTLPGPVLSKLPNMYTLLAHKSE